jgi:hypothetical protein
VSRVAAIRRDRRTPGDRLRLALELLRDPAFDALLSASGPWRALPSVIAGLADGSAPPLCHTVDWSTP